MLKKLRKPEHKSLSIPQILVIVILFGAWFLIGYQVRELSIPHDDKLVCEAKRIIERDFYEEPPSSRGLAYSAIRGMLYSIGDTRATFYEPESALGYEAYGKGLTGKIGIGTEKSGKSLVVKSVAKNLPAEHAGIRNGDVITAIDGWEVKEDSTHSESGVRIIGEPGTDVRLSIFRDGRIIDFTMTRIEEKPVTSTILEGNIGYVRHTVFSEDSAVLMKSAILSLLESHVAGIVWDLRGNPGGSGAAAATIINYFIREGTIFSQISREGNLVRFDALPEECIVPENLPLALLVDRESTSSAEVCTAAIKELKRGTIIGEKTYGKGTVNYLYTLEDGSLVEMTARKWLSPDGKNYDKTGIEPDILVSDDEHTEKDEPIEAALELILQRAHSSPFPADGELFTR